MFIKIYYRLKYINVAEEITIEMYTHTHTHTYIYILYIYIYTYAYIYECIYIKYISLKMLIFHNIIYCLGNLRCFWPDMKVTIWAEVQVEFYTSPLRPPSCSNTCTVSSFREHTSGYDTLSLCCHCNKLLLCTICSVVTPDNALLVIWLMCGICSHGIDSINLVSSIADTRTRKWENI